MPSVPSFPAPSQRDTHWSTSPLSSQYQPATSPPPANQSTSPLPTHQPAHQPSRRQTVLWAVQYGTPARLTAATARHRVGLAGWQRRRCCGGRTDYRHPARLGGAAGRHSGAATTRRGTRRRGSAGESPRRVGKAGKPGTRLGQSCAGQTGEVADTAGTDLCWTDWRDRRAGTELCWTGWRGRRYSRDRAVLDILEPGPSCAGQTGEAADTAGTELCWTDWRGRRYSRDRAVLDRLEPGPSCAGHTGEVADTAGTELCWTNWRGRRYSRDRVVLDRLEWPQIQPGPSCAGQTGVAADIAGTELCWTNWRDRRAGTELCWTDWRVWDGALDGKSERASIEPRGMSRTDSRGRARQGSWARQGS